MVTGETLPESVRPPASVSSNFPGPISWEGGQMEFFLLGIVFLVLKMETLPSHPVLCTGMKLRPRVVWD